MVLSIQAQTPKFEWVKGVGSTENNDGGYRITTDHNGFIYTTGVYTGTLSFSNIGFIKSNGNGDLFITKQDASGKFLWAKGIGGEYFDDGANSIEVDKNGNVYILGNFKGTYDFDPGTSKYNLTSTGTDKKDIFILKLDSNGLFLWAKQLVGEDDDYPSGIILDSSNNILINGQSYSKIDLDPGSGKFELSSASNFILNLSSDGNFNWAKKIAGSRINDHSIFKDKAGNIYLAGSFDVKTDFDPGPDSFFLKVKEFNSEHFILKLDLLGNFIWVKNIKNRFLQVTTDLTGNIFLTGIFSFTVDINPSEKDSFLLTPNGNQDIYVVKLNSSGDFIWAKQIGGIDDETPHDITTDNNGDVYVAGHFKKTVDFDPGSGVNNLVSFGGSKDAFILKLNKSGEFIWAGAFRATADYERVSSITIDELFNIYGTGWFYYQTDFDPNVGTVQLNSEGQSSDGFIIKLNQCSFIDKTTNLNGSVIKANQTGATYQWIDCKTGKPISGETNQSYSAKSNGNFAVVISKDNCKQISSCTEILTFGINEKLNKGHIDVYPNPTKGIFHIDLKNFKSNIVNIQILNSTGRIVFEETSNDSSAQFNIQHLADGLYFIRIMGNNSIGLQKIIKM
jgi:hypothetical protein